jgi:DNA uptake protein ComE-like DNA-binding protein
MAMFKEFPDMKEIESIHAKVAINYASKDELAKIPGVSEKLVTILLSIMEAGGNITPDILSTICRRLLLVNIWIISIFH